MLRVAIVGCGKIADSHASQVQRIAGCELVGACDSEPLMAEQFRDRFRVKRHYCDPRDLLADAKPDIVHITTPPATHCALAKLCLDAGCHVYVEKPFTVYADEASEVLACASKRGLKVTVGHDDQFTHVARRMRALVQSGYLGGGPLHMESYYFYELGASGYSGALLNNKQHWVRRLPGKLLHNVISHGIARIAEFLNTDLPQVVAHGFVSPALKRLGEHEIIDELRVIISEEERTTAYFTFSSQARPSLHQFRIYGAKNGLILDQDQETLIKLPGARLKSYAERFVSPAVIAGQYCSNVFTNVRTFLRRDFHMKAGMKCLIERFYRSITEGGAVPVPYREIVRTAHIMEMIFLQLNASHCPGQDDGEGAAATPYAQRIKD